jgi:hypothetical protein
VVREQVESLGRRPSRERRGSSATKLEARDTAAGRLPVMEPRNSRPTRHTTDRGPQRGRETRTGGGHQVSSIRPAVGAY